MELESDEYKCAVCNGIFKFVRDETWDEHKALEELQTNFGKDMKLKDCEIVCDDCWQLVKPN